jgi:tRNA (adenine58-N1)-methyltransferase non-catalytic subunit
MLLTTHAQVLVVEACCGVVTGAVAERLGGHGTVCAAFPGDKPPSYDASRL